jgi:hypothetical protein
MQPLLLCASNYLSLATFVAIMSRTGQYCHEQVFQGNLPQSAWVKFEDTDWNGSFSAKANGRSQSNLFGCDRQLYCAEGRICPNEPPKYFPRG